MSSSPRRQASSPVPKLISEGRVLSAADYAELLAGQNQRRDDSEQRVERLPSLHDHARLHGYRQGLHKAFTDLNATLLELRRCREDRAQWLQSFVLAILRKILGAQDASSLIPAIVQQAIDECDHSLETIAVRVHPQAAADVARRINKASAIAKRNGLRIDVVADGHLGETACELHTSFGIIDAGLDTQLDALAEALCVEPPGAAHGKP